MTRFTHSMAFPVSLLAVAVLAACGGGSDSSDGGTGPATPATSTPTVSLAGTVAVNGLVKNAVVCLDVNANSACDASEPTSAATGADGAYNLTVDRSAVTEAQQAAASLIALMVPGAADAPTTTVDQASSSGAVTTVAYALRQVPGKGGQINPLTTLVAAGVAAGMTEATARSNAALQLGIAEAKIDNYQDDAAFSGTAMDNARMMAIMTASALEAGDPLEVGDPSAVLDAQQSDLLSFGYTDASNYGYRDLKREAKAAGAETVNLIDERAGKSGDVERAPAALYNLAYLTPQGWLRCDASVRIVSWLGSPSRSTFCGVSASVGYRAAASVAGRPMADVVTELAADPANSITSSPALLAALGTAVFPANSKVGKGRSVNGNPAIYISSLSTDGLTQSLSPNLNQVVPTFQASAVNLATSRGTLSLGLSTGALKNLRVAFIGQGSDTAGAVQYYECDLNAAQTVASNCVPTQTGTYNIETVYGVRVMRFGNLPPTPASSTERLLVEVKATTQANAVATGGDWVFIARQGKSTAEFSITGNSRLNSTAWEAMKTQLGL